jgi:hypothetical protein
MQAPQIVVFEGDGRLTGQVRPLAEARRWLLREAKTPETALKLVARGGPTVLLLRLGRDLEREFGLLERSAWLYPATAAIVVGDSDHAVVAGLAWDLGARVVFIPAPERETLQETVTRFLQPGGGGKVLDQAEEASRAGVADSR